MEYKNLTKNTKIPVLGLGTWEIGGRMSRDTSYDAEGIAAIRGAIELGYTHIDTAEMYGAGHSEELVGLAIKDFDRDSLFITTKVLPEHLRYKDVIKSAEGSLKRLKTDYIDLYLIHVPNPKISIKETMQAMDLLVKQKKIRFIGVSNFSVEQLKEAQDFTENKIVNNQIEYNLLTRHSGMYNVNIESEIIPFCQENEIIITAWKPLVKGILFREKNKLLEELALKYDKTLSQIAINWLINKKNIITIPKSTNFKHLKENLGALGWKLSEEDMKKLDEKLR
ncbi:aldo/keto reductase [candidate division WOR-3 bacterium]|nr:aldo/keto reductase [candidate division WOR-3 bacterium]